MSTHEPDPVYVRASVWGKCNLECSYCPVEEGMENRVPDALAGRILGTDRYTHNLRLIAEAGVGGIALTGGEPTLRPDLSELIRGVRPFFGSLELTTNGRKLKRAAEAIAQNVDLLKVSLDSFDPERVEHLTGRRHAYADAIGAIEWAVDARVPLAINVVLTKETIDELETTVSHVAKIAASADSPVHLSLLDFYFSPTRRREWLEGFVPTDAVLGQLEKRFGPPAIHERFGCTFYWFDVEGLPVRLKDSYSATMRAPKCESCSSFCQEGIYGVKYSCEGWFTTCPSSREDRGVYLDPDEPDDELNRRIDAVLRDVRDAQPDPSSFLTMCQTHALVPSEPDIGQARPDGTVPVRLTRKAAEVTDVGLAPRPTGDAT